MDLRTILEVLALPVTAIIVGLIGVVYATMQSQDAQRSADHETLRTAFQTFQVQVARDYIQVSRLEQTEARIMSAFQRLEDKMDHGHDKR